MTVNIISVAKVITKFCVKGTTAASLRTMTDYVGTQIVPFVGRDSMVEKTARFIGTQALSIAITSAVSPIIDKTIDDIADKISDFYLDIQAANEKKSASEAEA